MFHNFDFEYLVIFNDDLIHTPGNDTATFVRSLTDYQSDLKGFNSGIRKGPAEDEDKHYREDEAEKQGSPVPDELLIVGDKYALQGFQSLILLPVSLRKTSSRVACRMERSESSVDLLAEKFSSAGIVAEMFSV